MGWRPFKIPSSSGYVPKRPMSRFTAEGNEKSISGSEEKSYKIGGPQIT